MPFFSVIIPVYNREHLIKRSVDSVLDQKFRDFELIVVNDGSSDRTGDILDRYEEITVIHSENRGVSAARNRGVEVSTAKWLSFLDSDDLWHRDKLQSDYNFIIHNQDINIFQCEEEWIRKDIRVNKMKKHMKEGGKLFPRSLDLCLISPSAVTLSRKLFSQYGPFDERLTCCEDYALWLPLSLFEHTGYIPEAHITKYGGHGDQLSSTTSAMDRFRIFAIVQFLETYGSRLSLQEKGLCISSAIDKTSILLTGAKKRDNEESITLLKNFIEHLREGSCNTSNGHFLLQEKYFLQS